MGSTHVPASTPANAKRNAFESCPRFTPSAAASGRLTSTESSGFWPRVAGAVLSQMQLMVPQRQQPLRAARVAQFVADLALALPAAGPGTRVVAPELLWDWAQPGGGAALLQAWLAGPGAACPAPQGAAPIIRG